MEKKVNMSRSFVWPPPLAEGVPPFHPPHYTLLHARLHKNLSHGSLRGCVIPRVDLRAPDTQPLMETILNKRKYH